MYKGEKVVYQELDNHEFVHVDIIDGKKLYISEGGELRIADGMRWCNKASGLVPKYDAPAKWNFVYENKNPNVEPAAYHISNNKLPELLENVNGKFEGED